MSQALRAYLRKRRQEDRAGRRVLRHVSPGNGIEYNQINPTHLVCKKIWNVDIARTPQVVKDIGTYVNVHGQAWNANSHNGMIHYRQDKVHGRGRSL